MKASILDMRRKMKEILNALDHNESVTITYRGKEKGVLQPVRKIKEEINVRDHEAVGMWADREDMKDVEAYVRRLRRGREHGF